MDGTQYGSINVALDKATSAAWETRESCSPEPPDIPHIPIRARAPL
jgi:hypothetical protein